MNEIDWGYLFERSIYTAIGFVLGLILGRLKRETQDLSGLVHELDEELHPEKKKEGYDDG